MTATPYLLDQPKREIVLRSLIHTCEFRRWTLHAAHVRTNHFHAVVTIETEPHKAAHDLKAYASRSLNMTGIDGENRKRWTRNASIRRVYVLSAAVRYVIEQGAPMALYVSDVRSDGSG